MTKTVVIELKERSNTHNQIIIDWYTNNYYLKYFLEEYSDGNGNMIYNNTTKLYEISFIPNEYWPKTLENQYNAADGLLGSPDDDGNYLINGYCIESNVVSIDGQKTNYY